MIKNYRHYKGIISADIEICDRCKYDFDPNETWETVRYDNIESWDIVSGDEEAEKIEAESDCVDDYHEYLILHFTDGSTSTFRNSYVDMFAF